VCTIGEEEDRNKSQVERFHRLILHPPTGSKIAAAKEFGVDLTLTVRKLGLSPTKRLRELALPKNT
jgi:hypothetical protein